MLFVRSLGEEEFQELKEMKRKEIGRVSQRAHMVLLSAKHWGVPRIAALFEVSQATVRTWIRKFNAEGPKGLYDDDRSGRPRNNVIDAPARQAPTGEGSYHAEQPAPQFSKPR